MGFVHVRAEMGAARGTAHVGVFDDPDRNTRLSLLYLSASSAGRTCPRFGLG